MFPKSRINQNCTQLTENLPGNTVQEFTLSLGLPILKGIQIVSLIDNAAFRVFNGNAQIFPNRGRSALTNDPVTDDWFSGSLSQVAPYYIPLDVELVQPYALRVEVYGAVPSMLNIAFVAANWNVYTLMDSLFVRGAQWLNRLSGRD